MYDVIIYELDTGKVESIPGKNMALNKGFQNAQKRLETVYQRINGRYSAAIVDAGKFKIGDVYENNG